MGILSKIFGQVAVATFATMLPAMASLQQTIAAEAVPGTFVGKVAGTDAFLAVTSDGLRATAFLCDGTPAGVSFWAWFNGEMSSEGATWVSTNGVTLELTPNDNGFSGTVARPGAEPAAFALEAAAGDAGFWRYQGTVNGKAVIGG